MQKGLGDEICISSGKTWRQAEGV